MAIEAPISKFSKMNLKIYIGVCLIATVVFGYDGYLSKYEWSRRYSFYKEHVIDNDGKPTSTMNFNRKSPPVFLGAAVVLAAYLVTLKKNKLVADENELIVNGTQRIVYDSIQQIDKTYFESKGFFDSKGFYVLTYKDEGGKEIERKISSKKYDNLAAVLDHLEEKIT